MSQHWKCNPDEKIDIKLDEKGVGAKKPSTVIEVFKNTVKKHGSRNAMALKRPVNGEIPKDWKFWTWEKYYQDCTKFAKSLVKLNVSTFRTINVLGFNSPEWFIANNGAILAGCIAAGIYTTNLADACHYVTEHSRAEVVVVEGNKQLEKYANYGGMFSTLKALVVWGEPINAETKSNCSLPVYTWDEFMEYGNEVTESAVEERAAKVEPGNCSTLIYTSGTTGPPKAVMLSHDNITWTTANVMSGGYMDLNHMDRVVSYLPLSHIAAQVIDIHAMLYLGGCTYFAQPDALKGSLTVTLRDAKPTFMFGVPRVWEKIQEKMVAVGRDGSCAKKLIGGWAKAKGLVKTEMKQFPPKAGVPYCFCLYDKLAYSKVKEQLGMTECKACFTAAAPISVETLKYFGSLDIPVYEVFGQSECTGPHTFSAASCWKIGTCGRPIKGTRSKIAEGTDELCYAGRHIFMGYMYNPEDTKKTIDEDGFLHSGDVATFDDDEDPEIPSPSGFMRITGRIKELIITAGGENIPPVIIENEMKKQMLALSNAMVVGERQKFLGMLVSLKCEVDSATGAPNDILAADSLFVGGQIGSSATTYTEAKADPKWNEYIEKGVKAGNDNTTSNAQKISKWKWLPADFSEKAGELTPTLKLKRSVVTKKYDDLIQSLYQ